MVGTENKAILASSRHKASHLIESRVCFIIAFYVLWVERGGLRLKRRFARFAGANPNDLFESSDEYFAITDFASARSCFNGFNRTFH